MRATNARRLGERLSTASRESRRTVNRDDDRVAFRPSIRMKTKLAVADLMGRDEDLLSSRSE